MKFFKIILVLLVAFAYPGKTISKTFEFNLSLYTPKLVNTNIRI